MTDTLYPLTVPKWGIEMQEGTITGWQVTIGTAVTKGQELIDIETDKIVNTLEAPMDGTVVRTLVEEGETLKVGELLGVLATAEASDDEIDAFVRDFVPADASFGMDGDDQETVPAAATAAPAATTEEAAPDGPVRASPVAKRLAKKLGVDLSTVKGSGRNGRISAEDVEAAAAQGGDSAPADATAIPFTSRRKTIARRLVAAKQEIPHYYLTRSVEAVHALSLKADGHSLNAVIMKAVAEALEAHPNVNCHVVDEQLVPQSGVHINMAVDTDQGLSAPLVRHVDSLALDALGAATTELAEKARSNQLESRDLEAGGFTVSNLGALGIESFTAIINPPQAAILAVGAVSEGHMKVTLSADHRVIDGADGARFLKTFAERMQTIGG
ncbi:MAG: dihydrolipoamide acetyltransferase family protein [Pseudomonadota bacterium]